MQPEIITPILSVSSQGPTALGYDSYDDAGADSGSDMSYDSIGSHSSFTGQFPWQPLVQGIFAFYKWCNALVIIELFNLKTCVCMKVLFSVLALDVSCN